MPSLKNTLFYFKPKMRVLVINMHIEMTHGQWLSAIPLRKKNMPRSYILKRLCFNADLITM